MFAHQVIEDLDKFKRSELVTPQAIWHLDFCLKTIPNSIKFSLGDIFIRKTQDNYFEPVEGKVIDFSRYKLPYSVCYFDWLRDRGAFRKQACLVCNCLHPDMPKEFLVIYCFQYVLPQKFWFISPTVYFPTDDGGFKTIYFGPPSKNIPGDYDQGILTKLSKIIGLLNCKNIGSEDQQPDSKANRYRAKIGRGELFTYKTLYITLPGKKQTRHDSVPLGNHNLIHFCRGHFKEYTKEAPLFGKFTGLWWWQPSIRGQNQEAMIVKDYRVQRPLGLPEEEK